MGMFTTNGDKRMVISKGVAAGKRVRESVGLFIVLLVLGGAPLFAQGAGNARGIASAAGDNPRGRSHSVAQSGTTASPWSLSLIDLRTYWLDIVPTGIDLRVSYRGLTLVPGLATILEDYAGGGYQYNYFFRNPNGSPVSGTHAGTTFSQLELVNDVGLKQGVVWNPRIKRNLVEGFLFYRFHYDYDYRDAAQYQLIFHSSFPDAGRALVNSVLAGFDYNTTVQDRVHGTWNGLYAEASGEWGPRAFFNSIGQANYYRYDITSWGYRTFFTSSTTRGTNLFSLYGAYQVRADYAGGSSIPIFVMQTFGGLPSHLEDYGLGDAVRGFETGAYDTQFKAAANFDLRLTGPGIDWPFIIKDYLIPGLYIFLDGGYYNGYFGDPAQTPGGFLASTGMGVYLHALGIGNVTVAFAVPFYGHRIDNAPYALVFHFHLQM